MRAHCSGEATFFMDFSFPLGPMHLQSFPLIILFFLNSLESNMHGFSVGDAVGLAVGVDVGLAVGGD